MKNPCIYICIPVYNRINYTLKCIDSIFRQSYSNFKIIICDDASTDGTYNILKNKYPSIIVIKGTGNLWWSGATNLCVQEAIALGQSIDYVYTLNNDTELVEDTLLNLILLSEKYPNSIMGSVNVYYNNSKKIEPSAFIRSNKFFLKKLHNRIHNFGDTLPQHIDYITVDAFSGKGVLIPIDTFRKLGLYNSTLLPHYHADTEFTLRAKDSGYKLFYCYKSKVLSHHHLTGKGTINKNFFEFIRSFNDIKSANHIKSLINFSKIVYGKNYRIYTAVRLLKIFLGYFKRFSRLKKKVYG